MIEVGATGFFLCPRNSWIPGTVEQWDGKIAAIRPVDQNLYGRETVKVQESSFFSAKDEIMHEDVDDLLNLTVLHDSTLINCLRRRYLNNVIYTNIGAIAVALNPFKFDIPAYTDDKMVLYLAEGDIIEKNLPHSWAVAHNTYFELRNDNCNQCVLVSGESGAGKTEASKIVMKYLAAISCKEGGDIQKEAGRVVGSKINLTSPPLECFGNAKTVRNDNSSRFGKFMRVKFDKDGFLVGAHIVKYLLEKSRIVTAAENERCYHSLYLVCRGNHAEKFGTENDKEFRILTSGNCLHNKEFDTTAEFDEVCKSMVAVGISEAECESMWAVVASVLHLGNVSFVDDGEGSLVNSKSEFSLATAAALLQVEGESLRREFTKTQLFVAGQQIVKLLKPTLALDAKEALMKALYDAQFQWLVDKCNAILDVDVDGNWIGLLDIFGFEMFETNSFEQLCINLANESLQNHYNTYIFERDLEECRSEGIDMSMVAFPDNAPCIHMVSGKGGIFALLDEECSLGKGTDDSFLEKLSVAHQGNPFFQRKILQKSSFTVIHYAGDVTYEVSGFLDKNRDTIKDAFKLIVSQSTNALVSQLLDPSSEAKKMTVATFFKIQLKELMDVLNSTNPHWIRCIKPHPAKKPLMWHGPNVMSQLSSSGVLGTVKIRKAGFPVRLKVGDFLAKFNVLGKSVEEIFATGSLGSAMGQKGSVRVFLKSEAYNKLEHLKKQALRKHTQTVQSFARGVYEMSVIRQIQRLQNGALYERLRVVALRLLALQDVESNARQGVEDGLLRQLREHYQSFEGRSKEIIRIIRQKQLEKQKEDYERRQREEALRLERERIAAQRREAAERRRREEHERMAELQKLHSQVEAASATKAANDLREAEKVRREMEQFILAKSQQFLRERTKKREDDKAKAESVKSRRLLLESTRSRTLEAIAERTEHLQRKGEALKATREFESQQQREEQKLKMTIRRNEAAMKLREEEERREVYYSTQAAIGDARFQFLQELKAQVQRDNCVRHHIQHIEKYEEAIDVDIARSVIPTRTETGEKDVEEIRRLQTRLERRSTEASNRLSSRTETTRVATPRAHMSVDITSSLISRTGVSTSDARKHRDPHLPPPIDRNLLNRLSGSTNQIIATYGTAALPTRPSYSVPWKR